MIPSSSGIPDLLDWLDLDRLHVYAPTAVVFLLGGPFDITSKKPIASFRDAFLRVQHQSPFGKMHFRVAEDANMAEFREPYPDWHAFEIDLAQLFELILLFCESAGSIAELGAFSVIDEIAQKLFIVVDEENYHTTSFIRLGIFDYMVQNYGRHSLYVMHYDGLGIKHDGALASINLDEFASRLARHLPAAVEKNKEPKSFKRDRGGHLIKLMVGLIQHFGALTSDEIYVCFEYLGIPQTELRIRQFARCAKFLGWIGEVDRGLNTFFVYHEDRDAIQYALKPNAPRVAKSSWRAQIRSYWQKTEPERFEAILVVGQRR